MKQFKAAEKEEYPEEKQLGQKTMLGSNRYLFSFIMGLGRSFVILFLGVFVVRIFAAAVIRARVAVHNLEISTSCTEHTKLVSHWRKKGIVIKESSR